MGKALVCRRKTSLSVSFYLNLTLPYDVLNVSLVSCRDIKKRTLKLTMYENSSETVQSPQKSLTCLIACCSNAFQSLYTHLKTVKMKNSLTLTVN